MSEQRKQILQMLADGKIDANEAEKLLVALEGNTTQQPEEFTEVGKNRKPRFLHIKVQGEPGSHHRHENVDIKVPIMLLKAGMKLGSLVPKKARDGLTAQLSEKGLDIDFSKLDSEKIDILIQALAEGSIDIDSDDEKVRIYCA